MYTVWTYDDATCDDMMVFEGTLTECLKYVEADEDEEFYIVEPDGFTVVEQVRDRENDSILCYIKEYMFFFKYMFSVRRGRPRFSAVKF